MSSKCNVIQIVPLRPNRPDGIGDYGTSLAQAMLQRAEVNSIFVSGTPAGMEQVRPDGWQTIAVPRRTGRALTELLSQLCRSGDVAAVIVHVSGYGYQKRGVPFWLLEGIRGWRQMHGRCRLLGIFHELFATGRVWNSSFWLSKAQEYTTRAIWNACDGGITTTAPYYRQLALWRPNAERLLRTMPVFSNVGEPMSVPAPDDRSPRLAVFGRAGTGQNVYEKPFHCMSELIVKMLDVSEVIDMGTRTSKPPERLGRAPIRVLGQLPPELVSEQLRSCRYGLLNYDVARLEKSGVFAAYAVHGVIPVCIGSEAGPPLGLEEGKHFMRWPLSRAADLRSMQEKLMEWYHGHSIARHADVVGSWCLAGANGARASAHAG